MIQHKDGYREKHGRAIVQTQYKYTTVSAGVSQCVYKKTTIQ